jgi:rhamnosyltransferase subunit B
VARILLGWELGAGLGHITRLLPIARALREAGQECIFALRSLTPAYDLLKSEQFPFLVAPIVPPDGPVPRSSSYGDLLGVAGYADIRRLEPRVAAWDSMIEQLRIDVAVAEFAPTLCLAALGRTPVVAVGDAFTLPSADGPRFPPFRSEPLQFDESAMLAVVQEVQRKRRRPEPRSLPGIFGGAELFLVTLPELYLGSDPSAVPIAGPLSALPAAAHNDPRQDYFAYLSARAPRMRLMLQGLGESGLSGSLYLRDATRDEIAFARAAGLTVYDEPQHLPTVVAASHMLIHHGGMGASELALAIGRPQILVPRHEEQRLTAARLESLGVGLTISGGLSADGFKAAIRQFRESGTAMQSARAIAEGIEQRGPSRGLERVVDACLRHARPPAASRAGGPASGEA